MPNTHIEHPEDSILSGDLRVLRWFTEDGNISVKIDGSPAIVWGTNPATKKFFVGQRSLSAAVRLAKAFYWPIKELVDANRSENISRRPPAFDPRILEKKC